MSSTSSPTLIIDVRTRRTETGVVVCILIVALLVPWVGAAMTSAVASFAGLLSVLVLASGFRQAGWLGGKRRIETVAWIADGRFILTDRAGTRIEATLGAATRVGCRVVWLQWRHGQGVAARRRSLLLTARDVPMNELRRLIVRLRIDGLRSVESQAAVV